ncbi:unnamed protein product [Cochlearia groenlandica]
MEVERVLDPDVEPPTRSPWPLPEATPMLTNVDHTLKTMGTGRSFLKREEKLRTSWDKYESLIYNEMLERVNLQPKKFVCEATLAKLGYLRIYAWF